VQTENREIKDFGNIEKVQTENREIKDFGFIVIVI
jgi:hypothetical protein